MRGPAPRNEGFTLLEVAVAVAILALALTAIFSSEAGAIKVGHRARETGVATLLARCKMGEIEEQVTEEGFPAIDDAGTDGCCEGAEVDGYACDWSIERVVLPDLTEMPEEDETATAAAEAADTGEDADVEELLQGAGPAGDAISEIAVGFSFPILKPSIEEQVRRATVTVKWREGTSGEKSFDVVQYLVSGFPQGAQEEEEIDENGQGQGQQPGGGP
ncbi:MAG: prepilin-type N-terminal cleavage/methylation domain-containing protein [Myxococcota bacterium]